MLISQRPTLTEEVIADNRSKFVIEPWSQVSGTRSAIRCAARCSRRSPALLSPASVSTAFSTSSPPSRA